MPDRLVNVKNTSHLLWVYSRHGKISSRNVLVVDSIGRYTHQKCLETLDAEIVDPQIVVKLKMRYVHKVHDAQT